MNMMKKIAELQKAPQETMFRTAINSLWGEYCKTAMKHDVRTAGIKHSMIKSASAGDRNLWTRGVDAFQKISYGLSSDPFFDGYMFLIKEASSAKGDQELIDFCGGMICANFDNMGVPEQFELGMKTAAQYVLNDCTDLEKFAHYIPVSMICERYEAGRSFEPGWFSQDLFAKIASEHGFQSFFEESAFAKRADVGAGFADRMKRRLGMQTYDQVDRANVTGGPIMDRGAQTRSWLGRRFGSGEQAWADTERSLGPDTPRPQAATGAPGAPAPAPVQPGAPAPAPVQPGAPAPAPVQPGGPTHANTPNPGGEVTRNFGQKIQDFAGRHFGSGAEQMAGKVVGAAGKHAPGLMAGGAIGAGAAGATAVAGLGALGLAGGYLLNRRSKRKEEEERNRGYGGGYGGGYGPPPPMYGGGGYGPPPPMYGGGGYGPPPMYGGGGYYKGASLANQAGKIMAKHALTRALPAAGLMSIGAVAGYKLKDMISGGGDDDDDYHPRHQRNMGYDQQDHYGYPQHGGYPKYASLVPGDVMPSPQDQQTQTINATAVGLKLMGTVGAMGLGVAMAATPAVLATGALGATGALLGAGYAAKKIMSKRKNQNKRASVLSPPSKELASGASIGLRKIVKKNTDLRQAQAAQTPPPQMPQPPQAQ